MIDNSVYRMAWNEGILRSETQRAEEEIRLWFHLGHAHCKGAHAGTVISKTQVTGTGKDHVWRSEDKVEKLILERVGPGIDLTLSGFWPAPSPRATLLVQF